VGLEEGEQRVEESLEDKRKELDGGTLEEGIGEQMDSELEEVVVGGMHAEAMIEGLVGVEADGRNQSGAETVAVVAESGIVVELVEAAAEIAAVVVGAAEAVETAVAEIVGIVAVVVGVGVAETVAVVGVVVEIVVAVGVAAGQIRLSQWRSAWVVDVAAVVLSKLTCRLQRVRDDIVGPVVVLVLLVDEMHQVMIMEWFVELCNEGTIAAESNNTVVAVVVVPCLEELQSQGPVEHQVLVGKIELVG